MAADVTATDDAPGDRTVVSLCTPQSLLIIGVFPFLNVCSFTWVYTAVPLHFLDRGWPLWQLGLLLTVCFVPRIVTSALVIALGDWASSPFCGLGAALSLLMVIWPNDLRMVWIGIFGVCSAVNAPVYRSLLYSRFESSGSWQQQRALRIFTLADTLGYSCGPFLGGLFYDTGGFAACATFSNAAWACAMASAASLANSACFSATRRSKASRL